MAAVPVQRRRDAVAASIRRKLKGRDQSAYWLAREIGVSPQQMSGYLNARHEPGPVTMDKIARALDCSIGDLYDEDHSA